jgi:hypothetical protein
MTILDTLSSTNIDRVLVGLADFSEEKGNVAETAIAAARILSISRTKDGRNRLVAALQTNPSPGLLNNILDWITREGALSANDLCLLEGVYLNRTLGKFGSLFRPDLLLHLGKEGRISLHEVCSRLFLIVSEEIRCEILLVAIASRDYRLVEDLRLQKRLFKSRRRRILIGLSETQPETRSRLRRHILTLDTEWLSLCNDILQDLYWLWTHGINVADCIQHLFVNTKKPNRRRLLTKLVPVLFDDKSQASISILGALKDDSVASLAEAARTIAAS